MQLANTIHLDNICVCTVLGALHAIKLHFKRDASFGHKHSLNITINIQYQQEIPFSRHLCITGVNLHISYTFCIYIGQCVKCVPTNNTYIEPYSTHIQFNTALVLMSVHSSKLITWPQCI